MTDEFLKSLEAEGVVVRFGNSGAVLSIDFREATELGRQLMDVAKLCTYDRLRELYLNQSSVTDDDLVKLSQCLERLQVLDLQKTEVSEDGISNLAVLQKLNMLFLSEGQVSQEFLMQFRKKMIRTRIVVS